MSHGGDDRYAGLVDGIGNALIIKGPQVFNRAAAAAHDQQIRQPVMVGIADGRRNFPGRFCSLDSYREKADTGQRIPLIQYPQHVMDRRAGGACNDPDGSRERRQGFLMLRGKQPLRCQFRFQLLKGGVKVAHAIHAHGTAIQLERTVPWVDGNAPHGDHLHAVLRPEPQPGGACFKHNAFQRRIFILQREIMVAGGIHLVIANLPPYRKLYQQLILVHFSADVLIDLGNG